MLRKNEFRTRPCAGAGPSLQAFCADIWGAENFPRLSAASSVKTVSLHSEAVGQRTTAYGYYLKLSDWAFFWRPSPCGSARVVNHIPLSVGHWLRRNVNCFLIEQLNHPQICFIYCASSTAESVNCRPSNGSGAMLRFGNLTPRSQAARLTFFLFGTNQPLNLDVILKSVLQSPLRGNSGYAQKRREGKGERATKVVAWWRPLKKKQHARTLLRVVSRPLVAWWRIMSEVLGSILIDVWLLTSFFSLRFGFRGAYNGVTRIPAAQSTLNVTYFAVRLFMWLFGCWLNSHGEYF